MKEHALRMQVPKVNAANRVIVRRGRSTHRSRRPDQERGRTNRDPPLSGLTVR
jgi:hypothetical protein